MVSSGTNLEKINSWESSESITKYFYTCRTRQKCLWCYSCKELVELSCTENQFIAKFRSVFLEKGCVCSSLWDVCSHWSEMYVLDYKSWSTVKFEGINLYCNLVVTILHRSMLGIWLWSVYKTTNSGVLRCWNYSLCSAKGYSNQGLHQAGW